MSKQKPRISPGPWSLETHSPKRPMYRVKPDGSFTAANEAADRTLKREKGKEENPTEPEGGGTGSPERE